MKTSELTGAELDLWVARAEGMDNVPGEWGNALINDLGRLSVARTRWDGAKYFEPHRKWSDAGPIIEREKLMIQPLLVGGDWYGEWRSVGLSWEGRTHADTTGPTPLIAAMRAYVGSKFGEEVGAARIAGQEKKENGNG